MIDMDHFKSVNDTYGHLIGDLALRAVVTVISTCLRASDKIIRYGGDEFTVIFGEIPKAVFAEKLEHIRKKVAGISIDEAPGLRLTVSIGAVNGRLPVTDALKEADQMLYLAKTAKNSVRMK